jgi:hypothetical protein
MRSIELTPKAVQHHFEKGDIIKVYTTDNTIITFEVIEITEEAIVGARETISFQDIVRIEKEKISIAKTAAVGGAVTLSVIGTALIATLAIIVFTLF